MYASQKLSVPPSQPPSLTVSLSPSLPPSPPPHCYPLSHPPCHTHARTHATRPHHDTSVMCILASQALPTPSSTPLDLRFICRRRKHHTSSDEITRDASCPSV